MWDRGSVCLPHDGPSGTTGVWNDAKGLHAAFRPHERVPNGGNKGRSEEDLQQLLRNQRSRYF